MNEELWSEVESAYLEVIHLAHQDRTPYLDQTYPDRPDIRREVESLLEYKETARRLTPAAIAVATAELFQEDENDLIGALIGGKYRIRECIGKGGQAEVYLADHIALEMPFALKRAEPSLSSDPDFRRRFLEEARRAVVLRHDNVARVHDVLESGGDMFVVMEHIEGENLRQRLDRLGRRFTVDEFLHIALQCASGIAAAHEKRIVHLDVKPENIMLTSGGQVKICDFGVSRRLSPATSNDTTRASTLDWTFAGTPAYMAPEVILSYQFDERADLFSLGTVFYEMLSGRNPFLADTPVATTARVVSDVPPPIGNPDVDKRLERIVMCLLAKDPNERYASASQLVQELRAARRSQHRFHDLFASLREALAEHWWMKAVVAALVLYVAVAPPLWIYRDRIEQKLGSLPLPSKKIVVVLPFKVTGDNLSLSYIDGLTDSLTATLNQLAPRVQIVPASDVRSAAISTGNEARKNFGANLALAGSVYGVDDAFRIVLTLLDTTELRQLRTSTFTVPRIDSISVQNQIIEAAIALLEVELGPAEQHSLTSHGTNFSQAYEFYLQGIGSLATRKVDGIESAIQFFRQALVVDSKFSLAYAGLGEAYLAKYNATSKDPRLIDRSREACEKAVALGSAFSAGYVCLGTVDFREGKPQAAIEAFQRALALDPANDAAYRGLARAHERMDNWEAAEAIYLKAIEVRPDYWYNYVWLAQFYLFSRNQYQDAVDTYKKAIAVVPDNPLPYVYASAAYVISGRYREAIEVCGKSIALQPNRGAYINLGVAYFYLRQYPQAAESFQHALGLDPGYYKAVGNLARTYYWTPGRRDEAVNLYLKAISLVDEQLRVDPNDPDSNVDAARYHAMVGHRAVAVSHLQIALRERPKDLEFQTIAAVIYNQFGERTAAIGFVERAVAGGYSITEIDAQIELDNLREDPRFRAIIAGRKATPGSER